MLLWVVVRGEIIIIFCHKVTKKKCSFASVSLFINVINYL
ncbi:hypothetical protein HMPREF9018_1656 [Prevotella amnii CRIS 21A-A]|uniref:Uncharacterized protein n=1 Tax=Prevotella amnii CRIS 21A-A TaxID=679191 RepID=E1GTG3_9BACT|nr:hypothetical protein HMPREF9018_1656 [Prevotella amnii CRIS 21A-A]